MTRRFHLAFSFFNFIFYIMIFVEVFNHLPFSNTKLFLLMRSRKAPEHFKSNKI